MGLWSLCKIYVCQFVTNHVDLGFSWVRSSTSSKQWTWKTDTKCINAKINQQMEYGSNKRRRQTFVAHSSRTCGINWQWQTPKKDLNLPSSLASTFPIAHSFIITHVRTRNENLDHHIQIPSSPPTNVRNRCHATLHVYVWMCDDIKSTNKWQRPETTTSLDTITSPSVHSVWTYTSPITKKFSHSHAHVRNQRQWPQNKRPASPAHKLVLPLSTKKPFTSTQSTQVVPRLWAF